MDYYRAFPSWRFRSEHLVFGKEDNKVFGTRI